MNISRCCANKETIYYDTCVQVPRQQATLCIAVHALFPLYKPLNCSALFVILIPLLLPDLVAQMPSMTLQEMICIRHFPVSTG